MTMSYTDRVIAVDKGNGSSQEVELPMADLRELLLTHPTGMQEVIEDVEVDFTDSTAKFKTTGITLPAGSVLKYAAAIVTELVAASGTTVKLGIGVNDGDVDAYGIVAALTLGSKVATCFATAISANTAVDVNGIVTNGSALGSANVTAGKVRVVIIYDKPAALE